MTGAGRFGDLFAHGAGGLDRVGQVVDLLVAALPPDGPLWSGVDPEIFAGAIEALDPLPDEGLPIATVIDEIQRVVLSNSLLVGHPSCLAHLHCPTLVNSAATELIIGLMNQSMDSFDQSPSGTLVEDRLVRRLAQLMALPPTASGVLTAGGTASNLLGLAIARGAAARDRGFDLAADGLPPEASNWRIVASELSHFSVTRAAMVMGLGRRAVVGVPTLSDGSMDPDAIAGVLAGIRAGGNEVIVLVGTAGTTDHGAIDPLDLLADHAAAIGTWFHVDAAVGGALALSDRLAPRLAGIGRADSLTVDLHKMWWQPISSSALLLARGADFAAIHEHSDYLDRPEDEGVLNLVGRSLDTTRRFDALKVLVGLRSTGRLRMGQMLDYLVDLTAEVAGLIEAHPSLELVAPPSTFMVLFRWTAAGLDDDQVDAANIALQRELFDRGAALIGRTRVNGRVVLKLTLMNPTVEFAEISAVLDAIVALAPSPHESRSNP